MTRKKGIKCQCLVDIIVNCWYASMKNIRGCATLSGPLSLSTYKRGVVKVYVLCCLLTGVRCWLLAGVEWWLLANLNDLLIGGESGWPIRFASYVVSWQALNVGNWLMLSGGNSGHWHWSRGSIRKWQIRPCNFLSNRIFSTKVSLLNVLIQDLYIDF